jgi:hypothetical protein
MASNLSTECHIVQFRIIWGALAAFILAILVGFVFNAVYSTSETVLPMPSELDVEEILKTVLPSLEIEELTTSATAMTTPTILTSSNYDPLLLFEEL